MNWIKSAIKHPGALRRTMHAKKGEPIAKSKLLAAAKQKGVTGRRARFALTLSRMRHGQ